jgi:tetratricopeptide (TPR) repeat protein
MPGETLEQLEGRLLGNPDFDSHLVSTCHRLWTKPVSEFTVEDLRVMIGQRIGVPQLVPRALEMLEKDPMAEGDNFPGDLLTSVVHAGSFLVSHPEWLERVLRITENALNRTDTIDEDLRCELAGFIKRYRPESQVDPTKVPLVQATSGVPVHHKAVLALGTSVVVVLIFGGLWWWYRWIRPQNLVDTGISLIRDSAYDGAIPAFREAIRLRPDYAEAYCNLGIALDGQSKPAEAVIALREAIRLKPDYADAHFALGKALARLVRPDDDIQARFDEVVREYREAIRLEPGDGYCYYRLGKALRSRGDFEEAIAAFHDAFRCGYTEEIVYYGLSDAEHAQRYATQAQSAYREAVRLKPADVAAHKNLLGVALVCQERLGEAIASLREAIGLRPDFAEAHRNLGMALWGQGKLVEAIAALREAVRLDPTDWPAERNLRDALNRQKELAGTIAE